MVQRSKVTIHDIARHAGVGVGTVSRVLNSQPNVSEATEAAVRKAIDDLGYRPAAAARTLRTNRSKVLGFITDEIATTPHAGQIIRGAQETAWKRDKILFLVNTEWEAELEGAAVDMMLDHQVDGIIYATMYHRMATPPKSVYQVPTVLLDCFVEDRSLPSVVPDDCDGGYQATKVLIDRGHRRIGFINNCDLIPARRLRLQGYRTALEEHGIDFDLALTAEYLSEPKGGYAGMMDLLRQPERPTAVFCFNDRMAMGAYEAIRQQGLHIPGDVAVIGFDNQELIAANLWPALTTVQLPHFEMGVWAVEHLLSHREPNEAPKQNLLKCPLVLRDSV